MGRRYARVEVRRVPRLPQLHGSRQSFPRTGRPQTVGDANVLDANARLQNRSRRLALPSLRAVARTCGSFESRARQAASALSLDLSDASAKAILEYLAERLARYRVHPSLGNRGSWRA